VIFRKLILSIVLWCVERYFQDEVADLLNAIKREKNKIAAAEQDLLKENAEKDMKKFLEDVGGEAWLYHVMKNNETNFLYAYQLTNSGYTPRGIEHKVFFDKFSNLKSK
jgi:hypothetical protein